MNQQELLELIGQAAVEKWTILDLEGQGLIELPPEIGQLTSLMELFLSENRLTSIPLEIGKLTNLTELSLRENELTAIPSEIGELFHLTFLDLSENELKAIPPEVRQLKNLAFLNLSYNKIMIVLPEIGEMINLTSLNLMNNQLTAIPLEIGGLTNLTSLDLRKNQLTAVPPEIGGLSNLTSLDLSSNQLTAIPSETGDLTSLTSLNLSWNKLTAVPPEIGGLTDLTSLVLNRNKLTAVPPEIEKLTHLTLLKLGSNKLTTVPLEIGEITSLTGLYLFNNKLTTIPSEIGQLTNLIKLELGENQLTHLPRNLQQLTHLIGLDLRDNPALGISREILAEIFNPSLILQAYFGEHRPLHEAKMLLVGQGGVGKTALARRLLHNLPPDDEQGKTEGVDIHKWQTTPTADPITLNVWDFGGQGVYQATHQFFFTSRSLYLIVINARTGERESRLRHWLKLVASLSDNAPVIIVVNKQDEHALQLDERELKHKYPNLLDIIPTSCTTGAGIAALQEAIAAALTHLPGINDHFPVNGSISKSNWKRWTQTTSPLSGMLSIAARQRLKAEMINAVGEMSCTSWALSSTTKTTNSANWKEPTSSNQNG